MLERVGQPEVQDRHDDPLRGQQFGYARACTARDDVVLEGDEPLVGLGKFKDQGAI